jgi:acetyl-CoA carboxylase biotin carboxyl carrier protein
MDPASSVGELVALIDRLESLLERSALSELEVSAGDTTLVLRKPSALVAAAPVPVGQPGSDPDGVAVASAGARGGQGSAPAEPGLHAVLAPLTGIFYHSPSPGAAPYVRVGAEVNAGQVIGLIEAMKLFNEIKSDVTGVIRRIPAADGSLVKAKQPLIEVEP